MATAFQELNKRVEKIEENNLQGAITLIEILSNATFFGEMKQSTCKYSKEGQCSFYVLELEAKNKIPIATDCRLPSCRNPDGHCHLELSNIACALCQNNEDSLTPFNSNQELKESDTELQKNSE